MERPDELTPEQLARMEAEEAIQDELISYLHLICRDEHESNEMLAEIIELALFSRYTQDQMVKKLQDKCLDWFDLMVERKVHGMPK